jgi:catechol 2,3-dioxygenase-like lactoylglutathione lyase family enzyme
MRITAAVLGRCARIERMIGGAKYVHTNLIARDWRELVRFYVEAFGCEPVLPQRDQQGPWLDAATGLSRAHLQGMHVRLPGGGPDGPTLEIYSYDDVRARPLPMPNDAGYGHVAFSVEDVSDALHDVVEHGGTALGQIATTTVPGVGDLEVIYARDPEGNIIELQAWRRADRRASP